MVRGLTCSNGCYNVLPHKAKLRLRLKSIVEESKCGKARLMTVLEDSEDPAAKALLFTSKGGTKSWCGSAVGMDTRKKSLLHGCDDREFSANLPQWNKHPKAIQNTVMRSQETYDFAHFKKLP
ncbi:reverse transcriptase [Plakobranchus ocellatus]|uniref:Reverse transcriptase n=1 Tax=Plakobranchus ocellatus TaxID=259542 RepID=A0AAV4BK67_9GAST|nr:reverse transcriptase [Plakobranchus ocellatus]